MTTKLHVEMNFCRRCGSKLTQQDFAHVFKCEQGHVIFRNASPAVCCILLNDQNEAVVLERAIDPGKGMLDAPGGFCDGFETAEVALARELEEEIGLSAEDYDTPQFLMSSLSPYAYRDEVLPVLDIMFTARIKGEVLLTAGDDAASVRFMRLEDIDMDKVYFPDVREAFERVRDSLS